MNHLCLEKLVYYRKNPIANRARRGSIYILFSLLLWQDFDLQCDEVKENVIRIPHSGRFMNFNVKG